MFVERPRTALGIALGTGQTFAAVAQHGVETMHCVEIDAGVEDALKQIAAAGDAQLAKLLSRSPKAAAVRTFAETWAACDCADETHAWTMSSSCRRSSCRGGTPSGGSWNGRCSKRGASP